MNQLSLRGFLLILTLCVAIPLPCGAQSNSQQETISAETAQLVRNKWEKIVLDNTNATDEWAGVYKLYETPTVTTHLAWSSESGFTIWWENCSRPGSVRVNYGAATFRTGVLTITPELTENHAGYFKPPSELRAIKWGHQHFLVPADQLINFAYAVNSGSNAEVESFLMKTEDYGKERTGLPVMPPGFSQYLGIKPIRGVISGFGRKAGDDYPEVILNVGKKQGVIPEMKFYLSRPSKYFMVLKVTAVKEHTAEAYVAGFATDDGNPVTPKVGWRFSSRAPKRSDEFMP